MSHKQEAQSTEVTAELMHLAERLERPKVGARQPSGGGAF